MDDNIVVHNTYRAVGRSSKVGGGRDADIKNREKALVHFLHMLYNKFRESGEHDRPAPPYPRPGSYGPDIDLLRCHWNTISGRILHITWSRSTLFGLPRLEVGVDANGGTTAWLDFRGLDSWTVDWEAHKDNIIIEIQCLWNLPWGTVADQIFCSILNITSFSGRTGGHIYIILFSASWNTDEDN